MAKFDPDSFGTRMGQVVKAALADATAPLHKRIADLETRLASLEAHRLATAEAEVQRLRGKGA